MFGFVVTSFVHLGGVLLVFSYLIVPAVCAILLTESVAGRLASGWVVATFGGVLGLWASFRLDLPTGAAIVCSLVVVLIVIACLCGLAACRRRSMRQSLQQMGRK
jgi:ABC-type Mn2+/Zn2+ transport system permease subunit